MSSWLLTSGTARTQQRFPKADETLKAVPSSLDAPESKDKLPAFKLKARVRNKLFRADTPAS